jgi:DNA polymerase-1
MPEDRDKTLLLIDSFALIFRAYYAFPASLKNSAGVQTNAVFGFTSLLLDVLNKFNPSHVIAVFDPQSPLIRQTDHVLYKANRKKTDEELLQQIPFVKEVLESFDIPVLMVDGYEADDVIGTIDKKYSGQWAKTVIVTGDQDLFQLVDDDTFVYLAGRSFSQSKVFGAPDVIEKLGITPEQVIDYKALRGDASDNIPGVPGIGEKTAATLIQEYGSLQNIYNNIEEIKGSVKDKLSENYEQAIKSQQLATIETNVPLSFDFAQSEFKDLNVNGIKTTFEDYAFKSLFKKLDKLAEEYAREDELTLFGSAQEETLKSAEESKYTKERFEQSQLGDNLHILANLNNLDKSPINFEIDNIQIFVNEESYAQIDSREEMREFFDEILDRKLKIYTHEFKNLLHALQNMFEKDYSKLEFEDLSVLSHVASYGVYSHNLREVARFATQNSFITNMDVLVLLPEIFTSLQEKLKEDLVQIYDLEKSIVPVVFLMEQSGISFDSSVLKTFEERLEKQKAELQSEIYKDVGHEFNINSPKQVGEVLFGERNLPGARKTKSGGYSTNERALKSLISVDPVVKNILNYREIEKLLSTYVKSLPVYLESDGKIHSTFDQLGAVSGRFSSINPNLQNIPNNQNLNINIRDAFVIESEETEFIAFDYSQQELRILAALAGEKTMIDTYNSGGDIHLLTASKLFNKDISEINKQERSVGKTINFSIVYGISAFGLSERLEIDRAQATEFINKFYETYPKIQEFYEKMKVQINTKGYSETIFGRRRVNTAFSSSNRFAQQAAERELLNFIIQGSAADIMKFAMKDIGTVIRDGMSDSVKLLLQIHDEFLFEVKKNSDVQKFIDSVSKIMSSVKNIGVDYKVDVKRGDSWGNLD